MSKKRIDVDKTLDELSERVEKKNLSPLYLLSELEYSVEINKGETNPPAEKKLKLKKCRQKDAFGFQIQNPTKPAPKSHYSKYHHIGAIC